jgi:hypothetical protein
MFATDEEERVAGTVFSTRYVAVQQELQLANNRFVMFRPTER